MPIDRQTVVHVADLARIKLTDAEVERFTGQLSVVLDAVEPAIGGLTPEGERTAATREDRTRPSLGQSLALEQAPDPAHGHFRVPKVIASSEEKENF